MSDLADAAQGRGIASRDYWLSGLHPASDSSGVESNAANRLLVAARDAFFENGYQGTTTRDIAARAHMSPAAMYIHYGSKQEMLFKICLLAHGACKESLIAAAGVQGGVAARLRSAVFDFTRWHAINHVAGRVAQYEGRFLGEENFDDVAVLRREIHDVVEAIVREGVRAGVFAVSNVPATTLAILSLSIDAVRWFPSKGVSDADELAAHYASLADRMVASTA